MKPIASNKPRKIFTIVGLAKYWGVSAPTMNKLAKEFGLNLHDIFSIVHFQNWMVLKKGYKPTT